MGLAILSMALDAISHLRASYNISKESLHKKKKTKVLFILSSDEDLVPYNDRFSYCISIAHNAGVIAILYKAIHQEINYNEWRSLAIDDYKNALEYLEIDIDELERINPRYVVEHKEEYWEPFIGDHGGYMKTEYTKRISAKGKKYIESEKKKQIRVFESSIIGKKLTFE